MSIATRKSIEICEQLPDAHRGQVVAFARSLLAAQRGAATSRDAMGRWLDGASGVTSPGMMTDQNMALTRGDV